MTSTIASKPSYGGTTIYAYDPKNELTQEMGTGAGGYTGSYGYDEASNPTTYKGVALTFDAEKRMTSYGGSTLTNGFRGTTPEPGSRTAEETTLPVIGKLGQQCSGLVANWKGGAATKTQQTIRRIQNTSYLKG